MQFRQSKQGPIKAMRRRSIEMARWVGICLLVCLLPGVIGVIGLITAQQFSFPSGHAMVSVAFYFYLAYLAWGYVHGLWRAALVGGLILLVLLIGLSRLYLEVHYLSDVVAGYLAGFLWTDALILARQALTSRRRVGQAELANL